MIIQAADTLTIEVSFDPADREEGYEDNIRFAITDSAPKRARLFQGDRISFLLTADEAEDLALALQSAANESRKTPRLRGVSSKLAEASPGSKGIRDFLEEAIRIDANAIEIEYKDGKQLITVFRENVGTGIASLDSGELKGLLKELAELKRKKRLD